MCVGVHECICTNSTSKEVILAGFDKQTPVRGSRLGFKLGVSLGKGYRLG